MDAKDLLAACRYGELNPGRAGRCAHPEVYRWSRAMVHLTARDDPLVRVNPMLARVANWKEWLASGNQALFDAFRMPERMGRPLGKEGIMATLCALTGRELAREKAGRKRKSEKSVLCPRNYQDVILRDEAIRESKK